MTTRIGIHFSNLSLSDEIFLKIFATYFLTISCFAVSVHADDKVTTYTMVAVFPDHDKLGWDGVVREKLELNHDGTFKRTVRLNGKSFVQKGSWEQVGNAGDKGAHFDFTLNSNTATEKGDNWAARFGFNEDRYLAFDYSETLEGLVSFDPARNDIRPQSKTRLATTFGPRNKKLEGSYTKN